MAKGKRREKKVWPGSDITKSCIKTNIEIRKDPEFVKDLLLKRFDSCPDWHPGVQKVELNDKCKPVQIGSARKLIFYPGEDNPEDFWEEVADITDNMIIMYNRELERPSYGGVTFRIIGIDKKTTTLELAFFYATNHPFAFLTKGKLKKKYKEYYGKVCRGIKLHCETGQKVTNTTNLPSPFTFSSVYSVYDVFRGVTPDPQRLEDPFDGQVRFCSGYTIEIRAPIKEVKKLLRSFDACAGWHPYVKSTERKGSNTTNGPGAVRKTMFYKSAVVEEGMPEHLWEEIMDISNDHLITLIQEENRPVTEAFISNLFKCEEIDSEHSRITVVVAYMPAKTLKAKFLAGKMKKQKSHEAFMLASGIKNYVETKKVTKFSELSKNPEFIESVDDTYSVFVYHKT